MTQQVPIDISNSVAMRRFLSALQLEVSAIQGFNPEALINQLSAIEQDVTTLSVQLDSLLPTAGSGGISELAARLATQVNSNKSELISLAESVAVLTSAVDDITTDITSLSDQQTSNTQALVDLDSRVTALEAP